MRQNRYLYQFLYRSLVTQIECGYLLSGQALPSQPELCRQYNVGITTVRKTVRMLAEAGYVRSLPGQPPVVSFCGTPESYATCLLQRRASIDDAFSGIGVLMPSLYAEGARRLAPSDLQALRADAQNLEDGLPQAEIYRRANRFFASLLRPLDNLLMMDLESDAETFLRVPHFSFPGAEDPFSEGLRKAKQWILDALDCIEAGEFELLRGKIQVMYRSARTMVEQFMNGLNKIAAVKPAVTETHCWFASKGRFELYAKLAMALLRRISTEEFEEGTFLPSIPSLMREYGVVKDTASRAVAFLNMIGTARTIDKKGTVVAKDRRLKMEVDWNDPMIRQRTELFFDALQIIALTARASADVIFPYLEKRHADLFQEKLAAASGRRVNSIVIQGIINGLINLAPFHSLRNVYLQLNDFMLWGYYLESADAALFPSPDGVRSTARDLIRAIEAGDRSAFSGAMESVAAQIYDQAENVFAATLRQGSKGSAAWK